jgi:two-component system chemotaxis response regulator CheB
MPGHDIIVAGASAGGVEALSRLVSGLPPDLPAAVFVVLHLPAGGSSVLPNILQRAGRLPARHARDGDPIRHGQIYVAPPGLHVLVAKEQVRLGRGPRENGLRPAADPLFRSAARAYGRRVVGVVLSGALDDGTLGLRTIKLHGGTAIAQDPQEAAFPSMPASALENIDLDYCLPIAEIAVTLDRLAREPLPAGGEEEDPVLGELEAIEAGETELELALHKHGELPAEASGFTCPECHGALWEMPNGHLARYECRVGHRFTAEGLLAQQSEELEAAIWAAYRALKEKGALARRMATRAEEAGRTLAAARFGEQAVESEHRAVLIEHALNSLDPAAKPSALGGTAVLT